MKGLLVIPLILLSFLGPVPSHAVQNGDLLDFRAGGKTIHDLELDITTATCDDLLDPDYQDALYEGLKGHEDLATKDQSYQAEGYRRKTARQFGVLDDLIIWCNTKRAKAGADSGGDMSRETEGQLLVDVPGRGPVDTSSFH